MHAEAACGANMARGAAVRRMRRRVVRRRGGAVVRWCGGAGRGAHRPGISPVWICRIAVAYERRDDASRQGSPVRACR